MAARSKYKLGAVLPSRTPRRVALHYLTAYLLLATSRLPASAAALTFTLSFASCQRYAIPHAPLRGSITKKQRSGSAAISASLVVSSKWRRGDACHIS